LPPDMSRAHPKWQIARAGSGHSQGRVRQTARRWLRKPLLSGRRMKFHFFLLGARCTPADYMYAACFNVSHLDVSPSYGLYCIIVCYEHLSECTRLGNWHTYFSNCLLLALSAIALDAVPLRLLDAEQNLWTFVRCHAWIYSSLVILTNGCVVLRNHS
jgi:hypothetical protein